MLTQSVVKLYYSGGIFVEYSTSKTEKQDPIRLGLRYYINILVVMLTELNGLVLELSGHQESTSCKLEVYISLI